MKETVVTFNNGSRKISMYFSDNDGNLDMQMSVEPELRDGEEPDLPMLLASTFLNSIQKEDDQNESKIITN